MRKLHSAVDRLVLFLIGAIALSAGVLTLLWQADVGQVRQWFNDVDTSVLSDAPNEQWWPYALIAAALLSLLLGLWLLAINLSPRSVGKTVLEPTNNSGMISVDPDPLASAAAQSFEKIHSVHKADYRTFVDRSVPTMDITLHCHPSVDLETIARYSRRNAQSLDQALPGTGFAQRVRVSSDRTDEERVVN